MSTPELRAFVAALSARPDDHNVLTVATRESGHVDRALTIGDLRDVLVEVDSLRAERGALRRHLAEVREVVDQAVSRERFEGACARHRDTLAEVERLRAQVEALAVDLDRVRT